ncbi:MAG: hypothetical protein AB7N65_17425 [Vicinamibacterales bacterium]
MRLLTLPLIRWPALGACLIYGVLACAVTWPLPRHLTTHFTGSPTGDLGVYVWNLWIFAHELTAHGRLPLSTDHVFAYTDGADFAAHNYTPLAGALGTPLLPLLGLVGTFNVLLLGALVTSGLAVFVLARRMGLTFGYALFAGGLFIASPVLRARETAHFSLVTVAALPLFVATLLRIFEAPRWHRAVALGGLVALATYSDAYYGVYCVIIGGFLTVWRFVRVAVQPAPPSSLARRLDIALALLGAAVLWRLVSGASQIVLGPLRIGFETLHNVMFAVVALLLWRAWLTWRPRFSIDDPTGAFRRLVPVGLGSALVALVLLLPLVVGLLWDYSRDRYPEAAIYWRSSPRGVDALAYVVPNPVHPWFGHVTATWWLPAAPDAFPEFTVAFPLLAWIGIAFAWWRGALPRMWVAFTAFFLLLSLGPFVHVAGINTTVMGPWALLRYVPLVGLARSPSRFAIVAVLGLCLLSAFALRSWLATRSWRRAAAAAIVLALAAELVPVPRPLYAADVPQVYHMIAASDDEQGRVLELPTGIRDGTSSIGNFSAASQFFQTWHRRPLIGGYLSRVSERRKRESRRAPILRALFHLSEGGNSIAPDWRAEARASRERFLRRSCVRYVVLDRRRASPALREFAVETLRLVSLHRDVQYELLVPMDPPECTRRSLAATTRHSGTEGTAPASLRSR